jgi:hypothetical protein
VPPDRVPDLLRELDAARRLHLPRALPFRHRRHSALFEQPLERRGVLYAAGAEGLALAYAEPERYVLVLTPGGAEMIEPGRAPRALPAGGDPLADGLVRALGRDLAELGRAFDVTAEPRGDRVRLGLVPRREAPIARVSVELCRATGLLVAVRIEERSGDRQEIVFGPAEDPASFPPALSSRYWRFRLAEPDGAAGEAPHGRP